MSRSGDYRGHPPEMWRDAAKIDLWKTTRRMIEMRRDFKRFPEVAPVGSVARAKRRRFVPATIRVARSLESRDPNTACHTPVVVDEMDNSVWRRFGSLPNMVYVIERDGTVAYHATWTVSEKIDRVLMELMDPPS